MNHRLLVRTVLCFVVFACFSMVFSGDGPVQIDVVSDTGERIVISYKLGDYRSVPITINGREYVSIRLPGEPQFNEKGAPDLPHVNRSIIIPDMAAMKLEVLSLSYEDHIARVAPSKGMLPRNIDPETVPYEFGPAYSADKFFPEKITDSGQPYIMRDHRGLMVQLNPFQYNPVTGVLRVYTEAIIEISSVGTGTVNLLDRTRYRHAPVAAFEQLYDQHFLNNPEDDGLDYDPLNESGEMLIICHDPWIDNMTPFVNHKATKGITATVVGVGTVGNDPTSIKNYIQDYYDNNNLAFVLLVGDAAQVATPQASGGASDPSYSKLAGSDNYPEIMVGRFSAGTAAEVDTQVERTITYENLPAMDQDWFWRGVGIASAEGAGIGDEGQSDIQHMNEIRGWLLDAGYTEIDQIYDPGATDTQVSNAVNAGRGIINYVGHGSSTSWGTTGFNVADVDALVNDNMLPFICSVACVNGNFDNYGKCFAEAWLRATNNSNGEPTGAVGMYASSINQSWAPPMEGQDEFNLLLTDPTQPYSYFGTLCFAGSCSMMDKYGADGVNMFNTWIIFGDPSVHVVGGQPQSSGMKVTPESGLSGSGRAGGPVSPDRIDYIVTNLEDAPMEYEVTWSEPWLTVLNPYGSIPAGGKVTVTVLLDDGANNTDNGSYSDTVHFTNLLNHDGDTTRSVSLDIGSVSTIMSWNMESDPGWTLEGEWEYGVPTGQGAITGLNPDPTSGATGSTVYGANLDGKISKHVGGPYYLTAGPLDLNGVTGTSISFQRWLNTVGPPDVESTFEVSADGINWSSVWSASQQVADASWQAQTFDISQADNRGGAYIRWGYQVVGRLPKTGAGWNIDDIIVEGRAGSAKVLLTVEPAELSWTSVPAGAGYDVVRGDLHTLVQTAGDFTAATEVCLADDLAATAVAESTDPAAGAGFWYLVRAVTAEGPLTYQPLDGSGSQTGRRDDEIDASSSACP